MQQIEFGYPDDFLWGCACAAFQFEGGATEDGRGPSMWDHIAAHHPEKIYDNASPADAADFYHRYPEDIALMRDLGLKSFRLSIAWPRIFPQGRGAINEKGLDFYDRVIDALLESGIEPFVDLYHWDLPQALMEEGGFKNPQIVEDFRAYARVCFKRFGDRVMRWSTMNEPSVMAFSSYCGGRMPPFEQDLSGALLAAHHMHLMHYAGIKEFRAADTKGEIGAVIAFVPVYMRTFAERDRGAARRQQDWITGWWTDPMFEGHYPESILEYDSVSEFMPQGYAERLKTAFESMDFLGWNYYHPHVVGYQENTLLNAQAAQGYFAESDYFKLYPQGLFDSAMYLKNRYNNPEMYITENGMAHAREKYPVPDLHDKDRVKFIRDHLLELSRALQAGADIRGYYHWSLLDTFESISGYRFNFGLVDIDRQTLQRRPRDSYYYYQDCIAHNGVAHEQSSWHASHQACVGG